LVASQREQLAVALGQQLPVRRVHVLEQRGRTGVVLQLVHRLGEVHARTPQVEVIRGQQRLLQPRDALADRELRLWSGQV
jgi:hypothetical protein